MKLISFDPQKAAVALFLGVALLFVGGGVASAATITNVEFSNGDVTIQGTGGQTVSAKVRIVVGAGEVVEKVQSDVLGDSLSPVCIEVGGEKGLEEGTHFVDLQVKLPPNTGTYTLEVKGSGIFGAFKTVDCTSNVVATASFGGALKVVGSSSSSSSSTSVGGISFQDLLNMINELTLQITALKNQVANPAPVKPAYCAALAGYQYLAVGMKGPTVATFQSFLMSNYFSIPAGATGYFGMQTSAANAAANASCK